MNSQPILLDEELDHCRMEIQATADLMLRSLAESYRLVASAQRRFRETQAKTKTARAVTQAA